METFHEIRLLNIIPATFIKNNLWLWNISTRLVYQTTNKHSCVSSLFFSNFPIHIFCTPYFFPGFFGQNLYSGISTLCCLVRFTFTWLQYIIKILFKLIFAECWVVRPLFLLWRHLCHVLNKLSSFSQTSLQELSCFQLLLYTYIHTLHILWHRRFRL